MFVSVKQELFLIDCLKLIEVYSHMLICHLLWPKVSAKKIHYCGNVFGKTDLTDFINSVSCTD